MPASLYDLIAANRRKTYFFILVFTSMLVILGYVIIRIFNFGSTGIAFLGVFIVFYNLIIYYNADKIALFASRGYARGSR